MKRILDSNFLYFILGVILASTVTVYAVVLMDSEEITFTSKDRNWKVNTVQEALDDLYKKEPYDEYTEITTVTPNESTQTLLTKDKVLKDNIIINRVPEIYTNLTVNTTVTESTLLNGMTAYDKNGNLITGRISSTECVSGSIICNSGCAGSTGQVIVSEFAPSEFIIVKDDFSSSYYYNKEVDSSYVYRTYLSNSGSKTLLINFWSLDNNSLSLHDWGNSGLNVKLYYIACK